MHWLPLPAFRCLHAGCPKGKPALYTFIQYTPLVVEKAGVAPHITIKFTMHGQVSVQSAGQRTTLTLKPMGASIQSRGNQWHQKIDFGPTKQF